MRSDFRPLRIAILGTRGIPARYGGFETFAEELGARLVDAGHVVDVYGEGAVNGDETYRGIRRVGVAAPRLGPFTTLLFDLRSLWRARRGYDLVYMLGYGSALFCLLPRLYGTPVWINMDGIEWRRSKWSWPARLWLRLMEGAAVRVASRVVADAQAVARELRSRHRRLHAPVVIAYGAAVVEHAPPAVALARWNLRSGEYYLTVCRLEPENHLREIIEGYLASDCARPLIVLGDINASSAYVRSLRPYACARVRFIGTIYERDQLTALRTHAAGYFHGHSVGGTNPSLLEALGCGNLILAHDNPFNREVAAEAARYFRSSEDIAALLAWAEGLDRDTRQAFAEAARERVHRHYTWDAIAQAYLLELSSERPRAANGCEPAGNC